MFRIPIALLAGALALALACDRNVEPYVTGERSEAPDLSRIFPERSGTDPTPEEGGGPMPGGRRGAPPVGAEAEAPVRGTVALAPELAERVPEGAVLFLIARRDGDGPPLAVKRVAGPRFPLSFELGPGDRMIETMPFEGPLRLSARLDADGNASTRTPGDLQGALPGTVQPGAVDVTILIDQVR